MIFVCCRILMNILRPCLRRRSFFLLLLPVSRRSNSSCMEPRHAKCSLIRFRLPTPTSAALRSLTVVRHHQSFRFAAAVAGSGLATSANFLSADFQNLASEKVKPLAVTRKKGIFGVIVYLFATTVKSPRFVNVGLGKFNCLLLVVKSPRFINMR